MPQRNPFTVLGLPYDASIEVIKAAWRKLAREHHPDVTSGDGALERRATQVMAEINAAYQELRDPDRRRLHREAAARAARARAGGDDGGRPFNWARPFHGGDPRDAEGRAYPDGDGTDWPVRPRPARPVTARIDTSALLRPRNAPLEPLDRSPLPGLPPRPRSAEGHEPPRASDPTGPMHRRFGPNMDHELPMLSTALETRLNFGKFAGLTLADVASIEPSYVAWIVHTIDRNPELLLAARVVLRYLERRLDTAVPR